MSFDVQYAWYLAYRVSAYVLMNLGDDVAMAAFMFT